MNVLDVHLLVGDQSFLTPNLVHSQDLASLFGPEFRSVPAYWLSPQCGRYSHNFLADDLNDSRIEVFGRSLATDYVSGTYPFLIFPGLIFEFSDDTPAGRKDWGTVLSELVRAIRGLGSECHFYLHLLSVPSDSEALTRLERLRHWFEDLGLTAFASEDSIASLLPGGQVSAKLEQNYLTEQVATAVAKRVGHSGLVVSDIGLLKKLIWRYLERLQNVGLQPTLPIEEIYLDHLVQSMIAQVTDLAPRSPTGPRKTK